MEPFADLVPLLKLGTMKGCIPGLVAVVTIAARINLAFSSNENWHKNGAATRDTRNTKCPPLQSAKETLRSWATGACLRPAAVIEMFPFRDEMIPTSVKLVISGGADCVAVLKPTENVRDSGVLEHLKRWAPLVKVVHGARRVERFLKTVNLSLIVIDTFQAGPQPAQLAIEYLLIISRLPSRNRSPARIVLGCQNAAPFVELYETALLRFPTLRFTIMAYHPMVKERLDEITRFRKVRRILDRTSSDIVVSVPFFFAPDNFKFVLPLSHNDRFDPEAVRILVVGDTKAGWRYAEMIDGFRTVKLDRPVELILFYSQLQEIGVDDRTDDVKHIPGLTISLYSGNLSHVYTLAQSVQFMLAYVEDCLPSLDHYRAGELSSYLAIATGFLKPLIACKTTLAAYGLDGQIEMPESNRKFATSIATAVRLYIKDTAAYEQMIQAQCAYRTARWEAARRSMTNLLFGTVAQVRHHDANNSHYNMPIISIHANLSAPSQIGVTGRAAHVV